MSWKRREFLKANALATLGWAVKMSELKPSRQMAGEKTVRV